MTNALIAAKRRDHVAQCWLRGQAVSTIAAELGVPLGTVKPDISMVRQLLLAEHADELRLAQARCMRSVYAVVDQLWQRYQAVLALPAEVRDERLLGAYLRDIVRANATLGKLTGVYSLKVDVEQRGEVDLHQLAELRAEIEAAIEAALDAQPGLDRRDAELRVAEALSELAD